MLIWVGSGGEININGMQGVGEIIILLYFATDLGEVIVGTRLFVIMNYYDIRES